MASATYPCAVGPTPRRESCLWLTGISGDAPRTRIAVPSAIFISGTIFSAVIVLTPDGFRNTRCSRVLAVPTVQPGHNMIQ